MKKFLMTLMVATFAVGAMSAQTAKTEQVVVEKKHECKDHKDGQKCDKPADQQCPDCKAKAAEMKKHECKEGMGHECKKVEGMKHECKEGMGHECKKGEGMKHECKEGMGHECKKGEGMKHECKEGMGHECKKAEGMKKHEECKGHKDGQKCDKPADQQCPDCKEKAAKQ